MKRGSFRLLVAALASAAACVALSPHAVAARTSGALERIVGRAVDVEDPTQATKPIDILIERWSTAEDVETLSETLRRGPEALLPALQKTRRPVGVLLTPGIMAAGARALERRAQNLLFARDIMTPSGRQLILVADEHLWLGEKPGRRLENRELTLVDIRFTQDGIGIGKVAPAGKVAYNKQTKIIEVGNFTAQPLRLIDVRSERP
jgi:hypothetical protein